ncbi:hypothetical protein Nepgr_010307 [Nepenthes gracilis]|uniref:Protein TIFY n=1 Tax=Nepenthes gracilis TaxID=150966 RepID=A0AAD3SCD3_NEPGR|nr:hypothetical protein Nepgr_010307 [Nepenthes gracilis]
MSTGVTTTTARAVLDKPLHELTEDDISQLTREDYRRYLIEKGMRRPSWNKSQAIQQVISLKSLLEPPRNPSSSALPPKTTAPPRASAKTATSNSCSSIKELSPVDADTSASANDRGLNQPTTCPLSSDPSGELECRQPAFDNMAVSPRSTDATDLPVGQMTVFYSGKINVYEGVPTDMAQTIMHIAASPNEFFWDEPTSGYSALWATSSHLPSSNVKFKVTPSHTTISQSMTSGKTTDYIQQCRQEGNVLHEPDVDGQTNRQVSLQRYLEKRKDRGRFRSKKKIESSSGPEMYLKHQIRTQDVNGQSGRISTSSPIQPGQPRTLSSLVENWSMNHCLRVDQSDKVNLKI